VYKRPQNKWGGKEKREKGGVAKTWTDLERDSRGDGTATSGAEETISFLVKTTL